VTKRGRKRLRRFIRSITRI